MFFAAGNDGDRGLGSVGSPANSKNAIVIGATETGSRRATFNTDQMASFSSAGPTAVWDCYYNN